MSIKGLVRCALLFSFLVFAATIPKNVGHSLDQLTTEEAQFLEGDPEITHKVVFEISKMSLDGASSSPSTHRIGELALGLFGLTVPRTVNNFVHLSNMTYGYGYKEVTFHRIIKDFMAQGGDFQYNAGTGGYSIYNEGKFEDENFAIKHNKLGRLSMANSGPDTNGAQFFITTTQDCFWLNGKHVVFGQLIDGFSVLEELNNINTGKNDQPVDKIFISDIRIIVVKNNDSLQQSPKDDKSNVKDNLEEPIYEEIVDESSSFFTYLFIGALLLSIGYIYKKWYYKRQLIIDIKESNFF